MRKTLLTILLSISSIFYGQESKVPSGNYLSTTKTGQKVKLVLKEDKSFELVFLYGTILQKKDSLYFKNETTDTNCFQVTNRIDPSKKRLKITLDHNTAFDYYAYQIYIGTQSSPDSEIVYQSLKELFPNFEKDYDYTKDYAVEIEKPNFIYLVQDNVDKESIINKYEIKNNQSELIINYNPYNTSNLELFGFFDEKTGELNMGEKNGSLLSFKLENNDTPLTTPTTTTYDKPIMVQRQKNWTFVGKEKPETTTNTTATAVDSTYNYGTKKTTFQFHLKTEKTFEDALKTIKKQPGKFLITCVDYSKDASTKFKAFVKKYEQNVTYYMYENYNPEYDKLNFHLINTKTKKLPNTPYKNDPQLLFYNDKGQLIYFEKGEIYNNTNFENSVTTLVSELNEHTAYSDIDIAVNNSKMSTAQKIQLFHDVVLKYIPKYNYETTTIAPPAPTEIKTTQTVPVTDKVEEVPSVVEASYDDYYKLLKEKGNFYQLKSTKDQVNSEWKSIFNQYQTKPTDFKVANIALCELKNTGFNAALFNETKKEFKESDFEYLDYLIENAPEIISESSKEENYAPNGITSYGFSGDLQQILKNNLSKESTLSQAMKEKSLVYYKRLIAKIPNNYSYTRDYYDILKENGKTSEMLESYDNYFDTIIKTNGNSIEQLDAAYVQDHKNEDWTTYKTNFASFANDNAWYIVENSNLHTKNTLEKAIKWSECSLQIEKNNGYYLDTLSQLYYRNGATQKGIETQEKAIANFVKDNDPETYEKMTITLDQMKKGTY